MHGIHVQDLILCIAYTALMWHYRPNLLDLSNWSLSVWEIRIVHNIGLMFVMNNVLPKYMRFTGARRHRNDMGIKKTYLTKNYFRLFLHIIGGAGVFFFGGFYLQNEAFFQEHLTLLTLKKIFIGFDLLHQVTIWLMLRNHDGIFLLRSNNLSLALQKVAIDIQLWECQSFEEATPMIAGLFLATAGFALTRFWCFVVAMAQVVFGRDFDSMRENWYSVGEWLAQFIIMVRMGVMRENNLPYLLSVFLFPHELWNSDKDDYQDIAKYVAYPPAALYFYGFFADVTQRPLLTQTTDLIAQLALAIHSMYYCGKYFKREPLPGVDYKAHRKSLRSLVERTIVEARKSIFMYGNQQEAAKKMRPSEIKRIKQELDVKLTPVISPPKAGPPTGVAGYSTTGLPSVVTPDKVENTKIKSAMRQVNTPSRKKGLTFSEVLETPLATPPHNISPSPDDTPSQVSDSNSLLTFSEDVSPALHSGISDIESSDSNTPYQDPDAAKLPNYATPKFEKFMREGKPVQQTPGTSAL